MNKSKKNKPRRSVQGSFWNTVPTPSMEENSQGAIGQPKSGYQYTEPQEQCVKVPPRFSWVLDGLLAASGRVNKSTELQYLLQNGVTTLVTLTREAPATSTCRTPHMVTELNTEHIPINNYQSPSLPQVERFVAIVDKAKTNKQAVCVHCILGRGRTGTMLACYLLKEKSMEPEAAIEHVRMLRPGSVETCEQEDIVYDYADSLRQTLVTRKPWNFSWVIDGLLAGCARPGQVAEVQYLLQTGVTTLVSLTERPPPPSTHRTGLVTSHLPVVEFEAPTLEQVQQFVDIVDQAKANDQAVAVHCFWGRGRTGTMLACYLLKEKSLEPEAAIEHVRMLRPGSVEVHEQVDIVYEYAKTLKSN